MGKLSNIFQFEASKSLKNEPETQIPFSLETPCLYLKGFDKEFEDWSLQSPGERSAILHLTRIGFQTIQ